jgi:tetratricopeptide (TPR) repeat protein
MAWTSAITGDLAAARRAAAVSLEQLRGQDEPLWTAAALITSGSLETAIGRYDDAQRHLTEARDLAGQFGNARLTTGALVQLGSLAVLRGRPEEARARLDEGLELSQAIHSTRNVTLCLGALPSWLSTKANPRGRRCWPERPRACAGRAGLRAWPMLGRGAAELAAQVRETLGAERFDQVFAAGARLNQGRRWPPRATSAPALRRPKPAWWQHQ